MTSKQAVTVQCDKCYRTRKFRGLGESWGGGSHPASVWSSETFLLGDIEANLKIKKQWKCLLGLVRDLEMKKNRSP